MSREKDKAVGQALPLPEDVSRRQILKGLASVPAIATLGASGGLAAQSLLCTDKTPPPVPTDFNLVEGQGNNEGIDYYCTDSTGTNIGDFLIDDPLPPNQDMDYRTTYSNPGIPAVAEAGGSKGQCVVYIDSGGNLTFDSTAGGQTIGGSCLVSIANMMPPP